MRKFTAREARKTLARAPGTAVADDPESHLYPAPLPAAGTAAVYAGRIREDCSVENGLCLWVAANNLG